MNTSQSLNENYNRVKSVIAERVTSDIFDTLYISALYINPRFIRTSLRQNTLLISRIITYIPTMDLTVGIIFVVVFLVSLLLIRRPRNLPPGPPNVPLLGSVSFLQKIRSSRPHIVFTEAAKKYGPVFCFRTGPQLVVVLSGYDTVHEALVKHADAFSGRAMGVKILQRAFNDDEENKGRGVLLNNYGHSWRFMRRFTLQVLRDFGVGKTSIEEKIFSEIDAVNTRLAKLEGKPLSINMYLQSIIGNVIFGIVFGRRYEYEDPEFESVSRMTKVAIRGSGPLSMGQFMPNFLLRIINKEEAERDDEQVRALRQMLDYTVKQIEEHEATFDKANIRDFVDLYLRTLQDASTEEKKDLNKLDMFRVIIDLFLAGSETTSTSLDWAFLYMIHYPEVQEKCYKEIAEVFGDKPVLYADRSKLVYVEATLLEIQRMATIVPVNVIHCLTADVKFQGYDLPKGTFVFPTIYSVSYDKKYWTDPETFNPERFIDHDGKLLKHDAMIPFSTGPRQCLGEPLARMELFLVFANLLQRFEFKLEDPAVRHSFETVRFMATNCPLPYNLIVNKRT